MSLSLSMATLLQLLAEKTRYDQQNRIISGYAQVALIMIQAQKITETDFSNTRKMLANSIETFPDLYYIIITNDVQMTQDLFDGIDGSLDERGETSQYFIIEENSIEIERFENQLKHLMNQLPRRIFSYDCIEYDHKNMKKKLVELMINIRDFFILFKHFFNF